MMPEHSRPASLYVKLPHSVQEWWDDSAIALWVYENVYRVMQERTNIQIERRDKESHSFRLTIQGIPDEKRARIRDVLKLTGMKQLNDPNQDTAELFDTP